MHDDHLLGDYAPHDCRGEYDPVVPGASGRHGAPGVSYSVDADEFVVNKLLDRGSLAATTIVTNVQDFITILARGLGVL